MRHSDQIVVTCDRCHQQEITIAFIEPEEDIQPRLDEAGWGLVSLDPEVPILSAIDVCPECMEWEEPE